MREKAITKRAEVDGAKLARMPRKMYIVSLTDQEHSSLEELTRKGKSPAYKVNHARILLLADTNREGGGWKDQDISSALNISIATIERVRQCLVESGLEAALSRKTQKNRQRSRLDGEQEAHLIALTCSSPPDGQGRWTLRMLGARMVELGYVEQISHETVRKTLKKTNLSCGRQSDGAQLDLKSSLRPDLG